MGRFIGQILVKYLEPRLWQLLQRFSYICANGAAITVPRGFVFDFASIPKLFWFALHPTGALAFASVIHDWLYANKWIRQGGQRYLRAPSGKELCSRWNFAPRPVSRDEADDIFLDAMKDSGVSWWKRNAAYIAVQVGGNHAWNT